MCFICTEKVLFREKGSQVKVSPVVPLGVWLQQISWWRYFVCSEDPLSVIND